MFIFRKIEKKLFDLRDEWKYDFYDCIEDIARHPVILRMKLYPHHGTTSCYEHCIHVAYYSYQWCRFFHLDARSAARGAMLHDLFLYDWHGHGKHTGNYFHALTHPTTALRNASKFFELNTIEKDVIYNHMWPVTFLRFPKTKEGFITTWSDKYCGTWESTKRR